VSDAHGWICTASGRRVEILAPRVEDIDIDDIAHALSQQCRYSGHVEQYYSVAEHSLHVMDAVAYLGGSQVEQQWALLHDAAEAYLVDLPQPIKRLPEFAHYQVVERHLELVIAERFGLPSEIPEIVRKVDRWMVSIEAPRLFTKTHPDWKFDPGPLMPWAVPQNFGWSSNQARRYFRGDFHRHFPGGKA